MVIQPSVVSYSIPYDSVNDTPYFKYMVNGEGVVVKVKEEQTSIDGIDNKVIKNFIVEMDDIDTFIKEASSFIMPANVELNPRTILEYLDDGMNYEEIAEEMETKENTVVNDLDKARQFFAPYAAAWVDYKK